MSITVAFSGTNYEIPEAGEQSWPELTDYLVALSTAATTTSMTYSARVATTTPQSVLPTDTIVLMNIAGASEAVLPIGVIGQFIGVYDFTGSAQTNPITVTGSSGEEIDEQASYVISSNYGGVLLQFNGTYWQIITEKSLNVILRTMYRTNNTTNTSIIEDSLVASAAFPSVADGESCTFTIADTFLIDFYVSLSDGKAFRCTCNYNESTISAPSDVSGIFLTSDAGTGVYVSKSATSGVITLKSRMGGPKNIEIHTLSGRVSNATAWA